MKLACLFAALSVSAVCSGYTLPELHSEFADLAFVTTNTPSYSSTTNGLTELVYKYPFSREVGPSNTWDGVGEDILRWNVGTASGFLANISGMIERILLFDVDGFQSFLVSTNNVYTNLYSYVKGYETLKDIITGTDTNVCMHGGEYYKFDTSMFGTNFCSTLDYRLWIDHLNAWLKVKDAFDFNVLGNNTSITNDWGPEHFYSRAGSTRFPFEVRSYDDTILPEGMKDDDYLDLFPDTSYIWPVPIRFESTFDTHQTIRDVIHTHDHYDKKMAVGYTQRCRLGELFNVFGQFLRKKDTDPQDEDFYPWKAPDKDTFYMHDSLTNAFKDSRLAYSNPGPVYSPGIITNAMCSYHSKSTRLDYDRLATTAQLAAMMDRKYVVDTPICEMTNFTADVTIRAVATNIVSVPVEFAGSFFDRDGYIHFAYKFDENLANRLQFETTNIVDEVIEDRHTNPLFGYYVSETSRNASAAIFGEGDGTLIVENARRIDPTGRMVEVFIGFGGLTYGGCSYRSGGVTFENMPGDMAPMAYITMHLVGGVGPAQASLYISCESPTVMTVRAVVYRNTHSEYTRSYKGITFGTVATNEYLVLEKLGIVKEDLFSSILSRCFATGSKQCNDLREYIFGFGKKEYDFMQEWEIKNHVYSADKKSDGNLSATSGHVLTNLVEQFGQEITNCARYVAESFPVFENFDGDEPESNENLIDSVLATNNYCISGTQQSVHIYQFVVDESGVNNIRVRLYENEGDPEPFRTFYGEYDTWFSIGYWDVSLTAREGTDAGTPKRSYGRVGSAHDLKLKFKNLTTEE